tara:strand:+ start:1984 stop:2181 length:198 start_codon:yes stop_codon:yes gene_type:complete
MKKGDLIKIPQVHVEFDDAGRLVKTKYWVPGIVVEDYCGNNLVKVYLPDQKKTEKVHFSTIKKAV